MLYRETHVYESGDNGTHERRWHTYEDGNYAVFDRRTYAGEVHVWAARYTRTGDLIGRHDFTNWGD